VYTRVSGIQVVGMGGKWWAAETNGGRQRHMVDAKAKWWGVEASGGCPKAKWWVAEVNGGWQRQVHACFRAWLCWPLEGGS